MWGWPNQQQHARDASRNIALTMFFAGGVSPFLWIGFFVFAGWLAGWFSGVGFSIQASKPVKTATDYKVRGQERVKNPFTWEEGVQDIRTAIRMQTDKQYISTGYSALARAYMHRGDKPKVIDYLQTAIRFAQQSEIEAKNEVDRNASKALVGMYKVFLQRCQQSSCRR
jgi:hypothetical protein